jgi:hypothetical protein
VRFSDIYWLAWLGLVFGAFLPKELIALFTGHPEDTLSDTMWKWCDVNLASPWNLTSWTVAHWLLFGFMTWLTLHLVWGYLR